LGYTQADELAVPIAGKKFWSVFELEKKANEIRQSIIEMLVEAKSGHSAGSMGLADIFAVLYFRILRHDPANPEWEERDRLILSNGHVCPVRYAAMAHAGYMPVEELLTLRKLGTRLQGHPSYADWKAVETTSGPLGEGLSVGIGQALAARLKGAKYRVYVGMSDAEQQEGMTWEAAMFGGKQGSNLNNLTAFIDRNNIQIDGFTEEVMPLEPLREKYEHFGWHVLEADGHNVEEIIDAFHQAHAIYEKPTLIIFHTIPGKGVDFMERDFKWHGIPPKPAEAEEALRQLRTLQGKIHSEAE